MQEAPTRLEVEELQENLRVVQELLAHEKPLARQYLVELRGRLDALHAADIAYVLEALPLEERLVVWDLVKADRDGEILLEVSDAVRETLIASMDSEELVAAAETLEADELADIAADLPASVIEEVVQSLPAEERQALSRGPRRRRGQCLRALRPGVRAGGRCRRAPDRASHG